MIRKMTVNMMVADVQKTIAFYQSQLEFSFAMGVTAQGNEVLNANDPDRELVYAMMTSGAVEIMIQQTASLAADIPAARVVVSPTLRRKSSVCSSTGVRVS